MKVAELPGYARASLSWFVRLRGLVQGPPIIDALGLPIAQSIDSLKCGVAAVELASGQVKALLEFDAGIEEVFDVRVNPFAPFSPALGS